MVQRMKKKHGKSRTCSSRNAAEMSAFSKAEPLQRQGHGGSPTLKEPGLVVPILAKSTRKSNPVSSLERAPGTSPAPGHLSCGAVDFIPTALTAGRNPQHSGKQHGRVREARGMAPLWGRVFLFY